MARAGPPSRFVVVAEVDRGLGNVRVASLEYPEGLYEGTARTAVEMATSLAFRQWQVHATDTGGVYTAGSGWGAILTNDLRSIGINVTVEPPGTTAASVVDRWRRRTGVTQRRALAS